MNILDALKDPRLLGGIPAFRDLRPWRSWLVFIAALYGLPLDAAGVETFKRHTGRSSYEPVKGGWREACLVTGRQSGKTRIASIVAAWESIRPGPAGTMAVCLAQDFKAAQRALYSYISEPFEEGNGQLYELVTRRTADTLALKTGVQVAVYPGSRPNALRGVRARIVLADEFAFLGSPDGIETDRVLLTAARPTLATVPGSKLLMLSSPAAARGVLFETVSRYWGDDASPVLVWRATAPELNPTLPLDYLERMKEADPDGYRAEVLGEFRAGSTALLDPAALLACVVSGRREIEPNACPGSVKAFWDGSGGRHDRAALAIGHRTGSRIVIAALRAWEAPHSPATVVAEAAQVVKAYGIKRVIGDAYAGELAAELWREHGLTYERSARSSSDLWLDSLGIIQSGACELPDPALSTLAAEALDEFRALERKPGGSGRDRVECPRRAGAHGDLALAVSGLFSLCPAKPERRTVPFSSTHLLTRPPAALLRYDHSDDDMTE